MTEDIDSNDRRTLDTYDMKAVDDIVHEDNKTGRKGKPLVKEKYRGTIETADNDRPLQSDADDEGRNFDATDRESNDTGNDSPSLSRLTKDEEAKQQLKDKTKAAKATFELPKLPKDAANDNYRPIVSWPLMDQLTRSTFEPNKERRSKYAVTARYIRELIDLTESDPLGNDKDCDVQRTESGSVHFDHGLTLDRKKTNHDKKNGEPEAQRFDGALRTVKKSTSVDNRVSPSDPFALRVIAAGQELDAIRQYIGSALWPLLVDAISDNASFTDIGLRLGYKGGQAPPVGSAMIRLALSAAIDALATLNWLRDEPHQPTPLPDKSRGSFWNQTTGPVRKAA
jgi:hypothetical protein